MTQVPKRTGRPCAEGAAHSVTLGSSQVLQGGTKFIPEALCLFSIHAILR